MHSQTVFLRRTEAWVYLLSHAIFAQPLTNTLLFYSFCKKNSETQGTEIIGHIKDGIALSPGGHTSTEAGDQYLKCSHRMAVCLVLPNTENSPLILYVKVQLGGP